MIFQLIYDIKMILMILFYNKDEFIINLGKDIDINLFIWDDISSLMIISSDFDLSRITYLLFKSGVDIGMQRT